MSKTMTIVITIIAIVIIVAVIFISCFVRMNDSKPSKDLEITKEINAGIPFKWEYEIEDPTIVECSKVYVLKDENKNGKVGASIYRNYVFTGLKEGTTKVTFKFVSITNDEYDGVEDTYILKVDKDLVVTLDK